jgi:DNA-binding GntR family transcriptional regulator
VADLTVLPPSHRIYTLLRQQLDSGEIAPSSRLPTEPELAKRFGVARDTVRRALTRLEDEGRIRRRRRFGTFASDSIRVDTRARDIGALLEDLQAIRSASRTILHTYRRGPTPPSVLVMCPEFSRRCLIIERSRRVAGVPFARVAHYVSEHVAPLLTKRRLACFMREAA